MEERAGPISVLFACDANYAPHAAACMASVLHNSPARFEFKVVASGDPLAFAERLQRSLAGQDRATLEVIRFQAPAGIHFPLPYHLTLETYFRFWIGDMFPSRSRAIYLDPDTIVTCDLADLWNTDMGGNTLAAVPIPGSTRPETHGMPPGSPFFNAGVLLFDLDAWRSRNYRDRCLQYLQRYPERAIDGDQDIVNLCAIGDWLVLPYEWNVINPFYRRAHDLKLPPSMVRQVRRRARIIHFNGLNKPWTYLGEHPRKKDYLANLRRTDWRDWRPADRTPVNMVRKQLALVAPQWLKRWLRHGLCALRQVWPGFLSQPSAGHHHR